MGIFMGLFMFLYMAIMYPYAKEFKISSFTLFRDFMIWVVGFGSFMTIVFYLLWEWNLKLQERKNQAGKN